MKRLSTGVLAALLVAGLGLSAVAAPSTSPSHGKLGSNAMAQADATSMAPANFGSPPSGQIPILFNDHHVYAKPDTLKQGRVLAALVRGGTILIPLRSMFEQMGATVSYDPASKTVDVSKSGADVKVTVGQPQVVINGETRPLDVPPIIYQGQVLVPIRVISEGMGAYVEWVPDRRIVVVRYAPPTAVPTAPPTEPPTAPPVEQTAAPTNPPAPSPAPTVYQDKFIVGDFVASPKVYNEFSPGNTGNNTSGGFSYALRAGAEFDLFNLPWMLEGNYVQWNYPHTNGVAISPTDINAPCDGAAGHAPVGDPGCVGLIGGVGNNFVPAFTVRDYDFDGRLGLKVANPRIYVGVGYETRANNAGYPKQNAFGFGIEKLPDLNQPFSVYGSAWYYPNTKGTCNVNVCPAGPFVLAYNVLKYNLGGTFTFSQTSPLFVDFGFVGDRGQNKQNAPVNYTHNAGYIGLGLKF